MQAIGAMFVILTIYLLYQLGVIPASASPGANWKKYASIYNASSIFFHFHKVTIKYI